MFLVLALLLFSTTFANGATVPQSMVAVPCGGKNVSPQLSWRRLPAGTRSLALIVHDPDAPAPGGYYHWAAYDIPPSRTSVAPGRGFGARYDARNDTGSLGYFGPCPPPGKTHHYHFTLYALAVRRVGGAARLTARELEARMRGHVLARATLVGLWRTRP